MRARHRSLGAASLAASLVAVAVMACSPAATSAPVIPSPGPTSVPFTASPPASIEPTVVPSASPATTPFAAPSGGGVQALRASKTEPLAAGTYTRPDFKPAITFKVAGGTWYAVQLVTGFFDIEQGVDSPDVIAVQFARPQEVYTMGGLGIVAADAETAATLVTSNPALKVVETSQSKLGGLTGFQLTVENAGSGDARVMKVQSGPLSIAPQRRLRVAFFDTPDGIVAVLVGGSVAKWQSALAAAEPVLESVTIAH